MKKFTTGDFDFSGQQVDLDSLQSFFSNRGGSHHPVPGPDPSPSPGPSPSPAPSGVQFRSIDGSGNNLTNTNFNETNSDFTRIGPANFADGVDEMVSAPNPRMISNVVVAGNGDLPNPEGLSGMMYAWGQFIDHDLDLATPDGVNHIDIAIPADDQTFTPGSVISLTRAIVDPATGAGTGRPATAVNSI